MLGIASCVVDLFCVCLLIAVCYGFVWCLRTLFVWFNDFFGCFVLVCLLLFDLDCSLGFALRLVCCKGCFGGLGCLLVWFMLLVIGCWVWGGWLFGLLALLVDTGFFIDVCFLDGNLIWFCGFCGFYCLFCWKVTLFWIWFIVGLVLIFDCFRVYYLRLLVDLVVCFLFGYCWLSVKLVILVLCLWLLFVFCLFDLLLYCYVVYCVLPV